MLGHLDRNLRGLECQLSSWNNDHALEIEVKSLTVNTKCTTHLDYILARVDLFQAGNSVGSSLSSSVLSSCQNVPENTSSLVKT